MAGQIVTIQDAISSATQAIRNPMKTRIPLSERRNCTINNDMTSSLKKPVRPFQRSSSATSAQVIPSTPSRTSSAGKPPAGVINSRRTSDHSSVGKSVSSQSTSRMPVADVDHGSDTATATIRPSAMRASFARPIGSLLESPAIPRPLSWQSQPRLAPRTIRVAWKSHRGR